MNRRVVILSFVYDSFANFSARWYMISSMVGVSFSHGKSVQKGFVWLDYFTEHKNIEKLTREVVVSLIREIKVFDKTHIEVVFDFDDCYKECLNVIASQGHSVEVDSTGKLNIRLKEAV